MGGRWRSLVSDSRSLGALAALKIRLLGPFVREVGLDVRGVGRLVVRPRESDLDVLRQVLRDRHYEIADRSSLARLRASHDDAVRAGRRPVIVDAGANIGVSSIWFSSVWPDATIVAVEPDEDNFDLLVRNTASRPAIRPLKAAVGAEPGFVRTLRDGLGWAVTTERSAQGCPVVTIAEAARSVPGGRLFIVKVDIEGFEDDLFASNLGWMDEADAVILEPHDWLFPGRRTSRSFQAAFGGRDFSLVVMGENLLYVRN